MLLRCNTQEPGGERSGMGRADEYRWFAGRCLEIARSTSGLQTKAVMVQMAQVWSRLADEIDAAARRTDAGGGVNFGAADATD